MITRFYLCIIGAGSSGITAIRQLTAAGIPLDCFEMSSGVGGNWRYNNDNGRSSAYKSLHIDTSKEKMQYADLPMSDSYPNFPHHSQVLEYFEQYVETFDLRQHITFRTRVTQVVPVANGQDGYDVTIENVDTQEGETRRYRSVLICNGHHWNPKMPDFPGSFSGKIIHSHHYRDPRDFMDQKVMIVGIGNSGADLSSELSHFADKVVLSMRRNPRIIPRYIAGRPVDKWNTESSASLPLSIQKFLYRLLLRVTVGTQSDYNFPEPDHDVLTEHPTVSSELLAICARGAITIKPNIERLEGNHVYFTDGTAEELDTIIYATGYQIAFPFFAETFFSSTQNNVNLFRKVVSPDHPNLYFIGLVQPLGAIMPLAEEQCKWVADLITGRGKLPDPETMRREIAKETAEITNRYVKSTRHTIQVDFYPYRNLIRKEHQASLKRALNNDQ